MRRIKMKKMQLTILLALIFVTKVSLADVVVGTYQTDSIDGEIQITAEVNKKTMNGISKLIITIDPINPTLTERIQTYSLNKKSNNTSVFEKGTLKLISPKDLYPNEEHYVSYFEPYAMVKKLILTTKDGQHVTLKLVNK